MRKTVILILIIFPLLSVAQSTPHATLFQYNHMMVNPGYAGMHDGIAVNSVVRNQYMGFEGAPSNQSFNVHMPFKLLNLQHGAGITLMNDEIGFNTNIAIALNYAFQKEIAEGKLGLGIGAGFLNQSLDNDWVTIDGEEGDMLIPQGEDEPMVFDLSIGGFYKTDNLFFGLSLKYLNAPEIKYTDVDTYPYYRRSAFLTFGYRYQLGNPLFELEPSMIAYTSGTSVQASVDMVLHYKSRFWGGLGYRVVDAVSIMAGAEIIEGLDIGLAYDITTSEIIKNSDGSFEFILQYVFKLGVEKDDRRYRSVRFL